MACSTSLCYVRDGDRVYETYWTKRRGVEAMDYSYALMDLTVYGRQESWERGHWAIGRPAGKDAERSRHHERIQRRLTWRKTPSLTRPRPICCDQTRGENDARSQDRNQCAASVDPEIRFPGESSEYRRARNRLLAAEAELRRMLETVAAQRRALPRGGLVAEDYRFEEAEGGGEVRFWGLFAPNKDTLVIYSFMFPRSPGARDLGRSAARPPGLRSRRCLAHPAPRSWTGSTVPRPTSLSGSTWRWSRSRRRNGSAPSPVSADGGTCGSFPPAATRTTATTTRDAGGTAAPHPQRIRPRRRGDSAHVG